MSHRLPNLPAGHGQLVRHLVGSGIIRTEAVCHAVVAVDRAPFVPLDEREHAYEDRPLPIGHGATISQPSTVAFMLELLQPQPGDRVLDIGAGSGWQAALIAHIVGERGKVLAVERVPELVEQARVTLATLPYRNIEVIQADGSRGLPAQAPFERIIVAAAAEQYPSALARQLRTGGRLVVPVGPDVQDMVVVERLSDDEYDEERYPGFSFVPLIQGHVQG